MKKKTPVEDKLLFFTSTCGLLTAYFSKHYVFGKNNALCHVSVISGSDGPTAIYVKNRHCKDDISNSYLLPFGISQRKLKEILGNFFSFNALFSVLKMLCIGGIILSSFSLICKFLQQNRI